ncbi:hypothetical protein M501DRAFT_989388 [Patellaria atrata CBS 101060]|uniref:Galactose oxidase n=1 Tax=Patellaria atrata CBS 101060 TaxID=1346257 RepID=A0A9P4S226_9PEZI|nr:hypothetical protein M501DRAFT_989388 [Patellaria atrata CBS 101060]
MEPFHDSHNSSEIPRPRRKSVFAEVGLIEDESNIQAIPAARLKRPLLRVRFRSKPDILGPVEDHEHEWEDIDSDTDSFNSNDQTEDMATMPYPYTSASRLSRLTLLAIFLAIIVPILHNTPLLGGDGHIPFGAKGGVIRHEQRGSRTLSAPLARRSDSATDVCHRWSHQAAIVNGTMYVYGGRRSFRENQDTDTWTNDFITYDLTTDWEISGPAVSGLPQPSGPPAVANGYLWNSRTSLFLYGGEFSEAPEELPTAFSLWEYNIHDSRWIEHKNPETSAGTNAVRDGQPVQRSAEGAGFNVASLGRGWYFGGHQDFLTTEGWSRQVARIYLKSMVEFTFPGATNAAVESLSDGQAAGESGVWRNITEGGLQESVGFTERADGILVYVPGFGAEGILLGLAGGTNATFTQMNVIDVFDIATSTWYKQATTGKTPKYRVNPCAVVAAAADGSSYNVYMFGGQNLVPYQEQIQMNDMWILSVPSFTWIEVDQSDQSIPYERAGHSCSVWDGQMIVLGGYVGDELTCESPGIYVFNMSSLQWGTSFKALSRGRNNDNDDANPGEEDANPFSQQMSQLGADSDAGLEGSYGYEVPAPVISAIGGGPTGGATITAPVNEPSEGPLATGKPITYTVTGPNGAVVTEVTGVPASTSSGRSGTNVGAIVAGVVAGIFFLIAIYFAFCAWVYRKQLLLYKNHVAQAQRAANDPTRAEKEAFVLPVGSSSNKTSSDNQRAASTTTSSAPGTSHGAGPSAVGGGGGSGIPAVPTLGAGAVPGANPVYPEGRRSSAGSSTDDLLAGQEPSFWGTKGISKHKRGRAWCCTIYGSDGAPTKGLYSDIAFRREQGELLMVQISSPAK